MNIYEDEQLENILEQITSQLGYLFLDLILVSLKKIQEEKSIFDEFVEARLATKVNTHKF